MAKRSRRTAAAAERGDPLMMRQLAGCALIALTTACGSGGKTPSGDGEVRVSVAPYSLPGVGYVCYDLAVSTTNELVWKEGHPRFSQAQGDPNTICSDQFGNGVG